MTSSAFICPIVHAQHVVSYCFAGWTSFEELPEGLRPPNVAEGYICPGTNLFLAQLLLSSPISTSHSLSPNQQALPRPHYKLSGAPWGLQGDGDGADAPSTCGEGHPCLLSTEFLEKPKMVGLTLTTCLIGHNCGVDALQSRLVAKHLQGQRPAV